MFRSDSNDKTTKVIGDDWVFSYDCFDPPVDTTSPSSTTAPAPAPDYDFYVPNRPAPTCSETVESTGPAQDLTGFVAQATLLIPGRTAVAVTTDVQSDDNLLSQGQFRIIVPHTLTSTIPASQFGTGIPCRLHVTLTDPRGLIETVQTLHITAVEP